jgi:hypothetical protein
MKNLLRGAFFAVLMIFGLTLWAFLHPQAWSAQTKGDSWSTFSGSPTGSCVSSQGGVDILTGNIWSCGPGGVWMLRTGAQPISCTTGSIGGSLLTVGTSASGTASCTGATTSMVCQAQATDGTNMAALGASPMYTVTASGVATVNLVAIVALTPAAKTYSVRVFP